MEFLASNIFTLTFLSSFVIFKNFFHFVWKKLRTKKTEKKRIEKKEKKILWLFMHHDDSVCAVLFLILIHKLSFSHVYCYRNFSSNCKIKWISESSSASGWIYFLTKTMIKYLYTNVFCSYKQMSNIIRYWKRIEKRRVQRHLVLFMQF